MIVVRFKVQSRPAAADEVEGALRRVVPVSRALSGVVSFDVGRDVVDPTCFIATEVFEDRDALERQESLPEVADALTVLEQSLAAAPEATIYEISSSAPWTG